MPESPVNASCSNQGLLERLLSPLSSCSVVKAQVHVNTDPFQAEIHNPLTSLQHTAGTSVFFSHQVFLRHDLCEAEHHT